MQHQVHYSTVTEALDKLRKQGFDIDFNLVENGITCAKGTFSSEDFEIMAIYRYEGETDPADEATVYAIKSKTDLRGVLVTGYGATSGLSGDILRKLTFAKKVCETPLKTSYL
ncbi:MAG: hypothetical protein RIA63_03860 [Cyclobacteriaceae bacterium]